MKRAQAGALVLAALGGASIWISFGAVAVINDGGRVATPAPSWMLVAGVVLALILAPVVRLRTDSAWPLLLCGLLWLPWIPGPIPDVLLIFEGRTEVLVWLLVVLGLMASTVGRSRWISVHVEDAAGPFVARARARGVIAFVAFVVAAWLLGDRLPAGDEPNYLIITQSVLRDGDLRIENNHDRGDYLEYYDDGLLPDFLARGADGEIYSVHAPGLSVLLGPAFAIAGYPGAVAFMALICAAALSLIWSSAFRIAGWAAASMAWAAVVFSSTMFFHSFTIFPDGLGAALVCVLLWWLVRSEQSAAGSDRFPVAILAMAIALLPWLHTRFALIAGVAAAIVMARLWRRQDALRSIGEFAAVGLVSAAGWLLFFWTIYGTPDPTAPYGNSQQTNIAWTGRGFVGILFDQQFGLVTNAPIMALVPYGLYRMARSFPRLAIELSVLGIPYLLAVSAFGMWWGGESAPARFLTVLIPLAILPLACIWRAATDGTKVLFVSLSAIGCVNTVARIVAENGALLFNFRDGRDRLLDWLSPTVDLTLGLPSVHRDGAVLAFAMSVVWLLCLTAAWSVLRRLWTGRRSVGLSYALTASTLLVAAMAAFLGSARIALNAALLTPASSALSFLERLGAEPTTLVDLGSLRRVAFSDALARVRILESPRPFGDPERFTQTVVRRVPAGEYRVWLEMDAVDRVDAYVGASGVPLESWRFGHWSPGLEHRLSLPTAVDRLVLRAGDRPTRPLRIGLQPIVRGQSPVLEGPEGGQSPVESPGFGAQSPAIRGARYGSVRLFLFDDNLFEEPGGLWTRGDRTTRFLVVSDGGQPVDLRFRAGAAEVGIEIDQAGSSDSFTLPPGDQRHVHVPSGVVLHVRTTGGFRPRDVERGSEDGRRLGVRIELVVPKNARHPRNTAP